MEKTIEHSLISPEREQELAKRIESGDQKAVDELVLANRKLVAKIASCYVGMGVGLEDLISAGNVGLVVAAKKFRAGRSKFSAYAHWRIKKHIREEVSQMSGAVSTTTRIYTRDRQIRNASKELGNDASMSDIARKCHSFESHVASVLMHGSGNYNKVSLDDAIGDSNDGRTWLDVLAHEDADGGIFERIERREMLEALMACIDKLGERERYVLDGRYGLSGGKVKTLDGIGRELNLSKEMVRVIEKDALKKLHSMVTA